MALCIIWGVLVILLAIFRCRPVDAAWAADYPGASCINLQPLYYATSSSNILLDVIVNLLPAKQIWGLHLPLKQRILLVICMCLGVLSIAAGIGRILTVPSLMAENLPATIAMPFLFVIIEPAFAIICACLPTYRPLALWIGHGIKHSRYGSRVKSFISSSSMNSPDSSNLQNLPRKNRSSRFFGRWSRPVGASANEKEVLTSTNTTPEVGGFKDGRETDQGWGGASPSMGNKTVVSGGRDGRPLPGALEVPRAGSALR